MRAPCSRLFAMLAVLTLSACGGSGELKVDEGFITADDGTKLYYVSKGAGKNVVVAPMAIYLEEHLAPLAKGRRVIFYDPRNRGRSDAADLSTVSLDRQVEDLEDLRESLGVEKMALIGWSGLGMEMAVYAIRHPDRVTRLVQMSPVPPAASIMREFGDSRDNSVDRDAVEALDARAAAGEFDDQPADYCRLSNELSLPPNFVDKTLVSEVADVCVHENEWPKNLWPYFGALLPSFGDFDWRDEVAALDIPRLVIHGREDGIPLEGANAWAAGHPQARLLVLSPSGHFPYIEQKAKTLEAIDTFLDGGWPPGAETAPGN